MLFIDYKKHVFNQYEEAKKRAQLSENLLRPTPAKIRAECLLVLKERYNQQQDAKSLRLFFGHQVSATDWEREMKKIDIDRFKPLTNFLKGKTRDTEDKNIELLAWLIDIQPRPYSMVVFNLNAIDKVVTVPPINLAQPSIAPLPIHNGEKHKIKIPLEWINGAILLLLFIFLLIYLFSLKS